MKFYILKKYIFNIFKYNIIKEIFKFKFLLNLSFLKTHIFFFDLIY